MSPWRWPVGVGRRANDFKYVERIPDPSDGRARLVRLTERGWQVAKVSVAIVEQIEVEWEQYLGAERMQQLRSILRELIAIRLP